MSIHFFICVYRYNIYVYMIIYVHTFAQEMALQKSSILVGGWPCTLLPRVTVLNIKSVVSPAPKKIQYKMQP